MAIPSGYIHLLENVPLNASYEHTIDFKDKDEQFSYFANFVETTLDKFTYVRKEREYIVVELPLERLDNVNYMLFRSATGERLYYAFVTNKVYVSPNTSQIFYSIDVMQTYQFDYEWRESYIKQAHVDRWTAEHKPIYSKTEEGLDYGTEYAVESGYKLQESNSLKWALVTTTNFESGEDGITVSDGASLEAGAIEPIGGPFYTFLLPIPLEMYGAIYQSNEYTVYDGETKLNTYSDFSRFMSKTAFGNYVRSVTLLPYNIFSFSETVDNDNHRIYVSMNTFSGTVLATTITANDKSITLYQLKNPPKHLLFGGKVLASTEWNTGLESSLPTAEEWAEIKAKPYSTKRDKRFESKLLCAPYRYNLLTDWRNSPVIFKNEYMTTDKIKVMFSNAYSHNAPFRYWIEDYKKDPEGRYTSLTQNVGLEFPIISDAYYTYMLENKNTIQANITNATINAATGMVNGLISGGGTGGVGGAIYGAVSGGVAGALNIQAQIRSENAKQADLRAKPDNVISSTDSSFNILDKNTDLCFYRMRICCENEEIIAQIFNMAGYKVNRVEVPNTRSRTRFNYIQTAGANIVGSINQADLLRIKEIYDNGVTIWHFNKENFKPLDYSYENIEVNLV